MASFLPVSRVSRPLLRWPSVRLTGSWPRERITRAVLFEDYLLGVFEPVTTFTGVCIAVIHRLNDDDDKLVIAPEGKSYAADQICALTEFQERFFVSRIIIEPLAG